VAQWRFYHEEHEEKGTKKSAPGHDRDGVRREDGGLKPSLRHGRTSESFLLLFFKKEVMFF
jgi:hypothetical protein